MPVVVHVCVCEYLCFVFFTSLHIEALVANFSFYRLLCALEGMYLIEESCSDLDGTDSFTGNDETQIFRFRCSIPDVIGRGFVEVCFSPFASLLRFNEV